jgi:hypothetical protein
MFNYGNLSDVEFEELCRDIMERKLQTHLHTYTRGRDGGIDICDTPINPQVMIQVKHYFFSDFSGLKRSLQGEIDKVKKRNPEQYYICTSCGLTPDNVKTIYAMFEEYMDSTECILGRNEIEEILSDSATVFLRKYPKLGITVEFLNNIIHGDAIVDTEELFYDVEEDSKRFVATDTYYEALGVLQKKRVLILTGNPGFGKTITSRMICLHMFEKADCKIVYLSDHNIKESKELLSQNPKEKELIFLDDCFGQRYFEMRSETGEELVSLLKYVRMNKNKYLLMNSRVTVYREAQSRFQQLGEIVLNDDLDEVCIDMNKISDLEKAEIFYNHLYFAGVSEDIMGQIRKDYNYRKIVRHVNYTPRLIKHITMKKTLEKMSPEAYVNYIFSLLQNPRDIWEDEYKNKLAAEDRIFMNILFSLTDVDCLASVHKKAYYKRLSIDGIDTSSDPWSASRNRLLGSMLKMIEKNGIEYLAVADPSVNDYLDAVLKSNTGEVARIISTATEYRQILKLSPDSIEEMVKNTTVLDLNFDDENIKRKCILPIIVMKRIMDDAYMPLIYDFFRKPYTFIWGESNIWAIQVYISLLKDEFNNTYDTRAMITEDSFKELLCMCLFSDLPKLFSSIQKANQEWLVEKYEEVVYVVVKDLLAEGIANANIEDFYDGNPMEVLSKNTKIEEIGPITDYEAAAQEVLEEATVNIFEEISDTLSKFPEPFCSSYDVDDFIKLYLVFSLSDAESILESAAEPDYDDLYDEYRENRGFVNQLSAVDEIFRER